MNTMDRPDNEFKAAVEASVEEHIERRANAVESVQVRKVGFLKWEYRFYWGRHRQNGNFMTWYDYETGARMTRQGALFAAARHLTKLQIKHSHIWETPTKPKTGRA